MTDNLILANNSQYRNKSPEPIMSELLTLLAEFLHLQRFFFFYQANNPVTRQNHPKLSVQDFYYAIGL